MPLDRSCCKLRRREPVEARVQSECVLVGPPFHDDHSGVRQAGEEVLVQTFIAQSAIEALDEAILGRLDRCDVIPFHALPSCQARMARKVNAVSLSLTTMRGALRFSTILSSSRATGTPDSELSSTTARLSRLNSSTIVSIRSLRFSSSRAFGRLASGASIPP